MQNAHSNARVRAGAMLVGMPSTYSLRSRFPRTCEVARRRRGRQRPVCVQDGMGKQSTHVRASSAPSSTHFKSSPNDPAAVRDGVSIPDLAQMISDRLPADMTDQEMAAVSSAVFDELMGKNYPTNTTFDLGTRAPPHHEYGQEELRRETDWSMKRIVQMLRDSNNIIINRDLLELYNVMLSDEPNKWDKVLKRAKYVIDRTVLSGFIVQYVMLLSATGLIVISLASVYSAATDSDILEASWQSMAYVLDSGAFADAEGFLPRTISVALTLVGLFFVSVLIGIVNSAIDNQLESLASGVKRVVEKDHIVVLGWNPRAARVVSELCQGYEQVSPQFYSQSRTVVVVLSERNRGMIRAELDQVVPDKFKNNVLVLEGSPTSTSNLELVGIATCRAVVVLSDKVDPEQCDSEVLEKLLLIESFVPVRGASTWTVAEVSQRDTARLISASFTRTSSITNGDIGLNLTLRSLLMPGLSVFFNQVLAFSGNEFYVKYFPTLVGKTFRMSFDMVLGCVPLGVYKQSSDRVVLLPPDEYLFTEDDCLVMFTTDSNAVTAAEMEDSPYRDAGVMQCMDDEQCVLLPEMEQQPPDKAFFFNEGLNKFDDPLIFSHPPPERSVRKSVVKSIRKIMASSERDERDRFGVKKPHGKVLLCGWRQGLAGMLMHLDKHLAFGSQVHILSTVPLEERNELLESEGMEYDQIRNIRIVHYQGSPFSRRSLKLLPCELFTAVLFMTQIPLQDVSIDTKVLMGTLFIRDIITKRGGDVHKVSIVNELWGSIDIETPGTEYVQIGALDASAIAQVATQPRTMAVLDKIFTTDKLAIAYCPASRIVEPGESKSFMTVQARVRSEGAVMMGRVDPDGTLVLNPDNKNELRTWTAADQIIVLYEPIQKKQETNGVTAKEDSRTQPLNFWGSS